MRKNKKRLKNNRKPRPLRSKQLKKLKKLDLQLKNQLVKTRNSRKKQLRTKSTNKWLLKPQNKKNKLN